MSTHSNKVCRPSEKRANPREGGGEGDVEQKVRKMRFFVVPEQLRADDALDLGVKMRKEVRMAQQHPVEKENVVDLHDIEDDEVAREKRAEGETVFDVVLRGEDCRTEKQQHRQDAEVPAEDMRTAEALGFSLRNGGEDLTRRGGEEFLLLNEPDAGVQ